MIPPKTRTHMMNSCRNVDTLSVYSQWRDIPIVFSEMKSVALRTQSRMGRTSSVAI